MVGVWTRTAILLVGFVALGGCGGGGTAPASQPNGTASSSVAGAQLGGTIKIDGSSTVYPITEAVAEEFQKQHPGVRVTVGISGTGGGFKKFGPGETDISDASRPIRANEAELCASNGIEFVELPVAYDALTVVVNPQNDWAQSITTAELKKMWEPAAQGTVTKWSQVRPGWPDRPLKLYGAGSDSGTFDYFTDAINGKEKACRGDYTASEDDNVLVQGVSRDPNALGFFGLAYFQENAAKLKALPVDDEKADNGAGPQDPNVDNVVKGTYQPLSRPLFIYVSKKAGERPEVKAFVDFYLKGAADFVKEVGYIALQPEVYQLAQDRYSQGTTGSIFAGGGSQVGVKLDDLLKQEKR
jgi:phosphate transport system substrate-binding protein